MIRPLAVIVAGCLMLASCSGASDRDETVLVNADAADMAEPVVYDAAADAPTPPPRPSPVSTAGIGSPGRATASMPDFGEPNPDAEPRPRIAAARGFSLARDPAFSIVPVFFATNRAPSDETESAERRYANAAGPLSFGKLAITVPRRRHVVGRIERPGWFTALYRDPDPRRHFTIGSFTRLDRQQVLDEISRRMADQASRGGGRQALIFVHGFNVQFDDAAFRTAQMAHDMKFRGAAVFYSWPSAFNTALYPHDASRIEESRPLIKAFIADVIARAGADHAYIIAHSMGTRGVSRAIAELSQEQPAVTAKIAALILAAPDINATVFRNDIAPHLSRMARNVTLYASAEDVALEASYRVNGARALGDARGGLRVFPGMDSIDASAVGTSFLRHSEYGDSPFLLNDIAQVMQGRTPAQRIWLDPRTPPVGAYEFVRVR